MIVCVLDAREGSIKRYESRKKTHSACADRPLTFTAQFVEQFRTRPPDEFEHWTPPPRPTNPLSTALKAA